MTTRADTINTIIASRKPHVEKTAKTIEQLRQLESSLNAFSAFLSHTKDKVGKEYHEKIDHLLHKLLNLTNGDIADRKKELNQLYNRFNRQTLNIGVVGNARQGKSTFLQALTGLTNDEIPAAATDHCTGAPSVIINDTQTYADVEFYDEKTLLEDVIKPFYTKLGLSPNPSSFRNFKDNPLPPLESKSKTDELLYDKLKSRHENCDKYERLLNQSEKRINRKEFLDYIAQQKAGQKIYNWVAVKMVTIHCPFAVEDVGKLSVCDTPGLGDFVCGAEDNLTRNIGDSIDTVLMLKRVPDGGIVKPEDTQLYDLIPKAIPELEAKDWSYFIVNRSGTPAELAEFQKQVQEKIKVRRLITLDAREKNVVLAEFENILNDVAANQQKLDETLYAARVANVKALVGDINTFLAEAGAALPTGGNANFGTLRPAFEECWKSVTYELNKIVKKYGDMVDFPDEHLVEKVQEIKVSQGRYIKERLKKVSEKDISGAGGLPHFSPQMMGELRIELSQAFVALDKIFDEEFSAIRREAYDVLTSSEIGKLGGIIEISDPIEWLCELSHRFRSVETDIDDANRVADSIEFFATTSFLFSNYLLQRVREKLNVLNPDHPAAKDFVFTPGDTWEDVSEQLEMSFDKALSEIAAALKKLSPDVYKAKFAMIEQFKDGVTFSGSFETAKNMWYGFYQEYRAEIWTSLFAQLEENTKLRNDWDQHLASIKRASEGLVWKVECGKWSVESEVFSCRS